MDLSTQTQHGSEVRDDMRVAHAIDRVLEAERAAQSAIAECEKQCQESLERGRQQRRTILERTHERVVALHTKAARALEQRNTQLREQHGQAVATAVTQHADHARAQAALEKLVDRLTGVGDEEIESRGHRR
jgi:vacuolar-type H+-ATPase subunit H